MSFFARYPVSLWPIAIVAVIVVFTLLGEEARMWLRYARPQVEAGEFWRFITAHWAHLGWEHALLNSGGLLLVAWMHPKGDWKVWLGFYLLAGLLISSHLHWNHDLYAYVGASGVLHGLLILAAYQSQWLERWRKWALITCIVIKLIWEQTPAYSDESIASVIGGYVVVDAHLIGGLAGIVCLIILLLGKKFESSVRSEK